MSSNYKAFSYLYDVMNYDIPYNLWIDIIMPYNKNTSILDIGSGTGEILKQLKANRKIGIDNSKEMISIAKDNDNTSEYKLQDMHDLSLNESFDLIIATVDVMNYVDSQKSFIHVLKEVKQHLSNDGTFIFDIHSPYKMNTFNDGDIFTDDSEDYVYIWQTFKEDSLSVYHQITFFIKQDNSNLYERFEETHFQKTFEHKEVLDILSKLHFEVINTFSDFAPDGDIKEMSERTFYIVKNK